MTHEEALTLLPAYAIGALDQGVDALEEHVRRCRRCRAELAEYYETTVRLAEAVEIHEPPRGLRAAVLAEVPVRSSPGRRLLEWWTRSALMSRSAVAALAMMLLVVGLTAGVAVQGRQADETRARLALDERGLALLTSTETTTVRLDPVVPSQAHGHWYHRPGVDAQVLVVEFLPALGPDEAYYGWLGRSDGTWIPTGRLETDANGHGRTILVGSDGSDVRRVVVTRGKGGSSQPEGETVLAWSAP